VVFHCDDILRLQMDVFIAIVAGLAFRLCLTNLDGPLAILTPTLLGLCEGALVHYLPNRTSLLDHYLAYGLRIVVDLFFTENISRMILVLLWTALSVVASDALKPVSHHERKRSRRYTVSHTVRTRTPRPQQLATPPPSKPPLTLTPLRLPPYELNPHPVTPLQHPNRPPSPPSFFLEGESETNIISPTSEDQLEYGPESDLRSNSSSPKVILLPTPPSTLMTDAQQSDTLSHHRLSTIPELSGDESANLDKTDVWTEADHVRPPGAHIVFDQAKPSYAPSVVTSAPLPVPNAAYTHANWAPKTDHDTDDSDPSNSPTVSSSTPLPVPNAAIRSQQSEDKADTASEPDELRTPDAHDWELTDHDELRTPAAPQKELSPLFSDQQLPASFGVTGEVHSSITPPPVPVVDPGISNIPSSGIPVMSTFLNSSVECFPAVVNDQNPDLDKLSEAETLQTETDSTSVMSPGNSKRLFSRGEYFRQEARKEDKQRMMLDGKLKAALREARIRESLFLREDIRVLEERVKKLHEKAARRFFKGRYISRPFI
jgi:hypothetical protein